MDQLPLSSTLAAKTLPRISRDEMNLAEFPLTVLSTRLDPKVKTLEFSDTVHAKNGELVNRKWIITGADKFGLPTSSDDEVLLGLLKLTVDDEFKERKVFFTRYELLKILRWSTEGRNYLRLQRALDRLSGVRIKATNAFYDNEAKSHSTRNFGLIDAYEINDGRECERKPSFFIWSEVLFKSFQVGFIKKLDLDFYLGLRSAVTRRLYRYLDKHFWYKSKVQINLFTLAHEKIGISRTYRFASSIKQQLEPACEELVARNFISGASYIGKGQETTVVFYSAKQQPRIQIGRGDPNEKNLTEQKENKSLYEDIVERLVKRGLREVQVRKLLEGKDENDLVRVGEIIEHYDYLLTNQSSRINKSPVGFLYRAVENFKTFTLPAENKNAQTQRPRQERLVLNSAQSTENLLESSYLVERKKEIRRLRAEVEPQMLLNIKSQVEGALSKLRASISEERFKETVEHGVEEQLAKLFVLPSFEEWLKRRG